MKINPITIRNNSQAFKGSLNLGDLIKSALSKKDGNIFGNGQDSFVKNGGSFSDPSQPIVIEHLEIKADETSKNGKTLKGMAKAGGGAITGGSVVKMLGQDDENETDIDTDSEDTQEIEHSDEDGNDIDEQDDNNSGDLEDDDDVDDTDLNDGFDNDLDDDLDDDFDDDIDDDF